MLHGRCYSAMFYCKQMCLSVPCFQVLRGGLNLLRRLYSGSNMADS